MSSKAPATLLTNVQLPSEVTLDVRALCDLEMLLSGAFAPLEGYHNFADFCSVVTSSRLTTGSVWPIPITLGVPKSAITPTENPAPKGRVLKIVDIIGTILAEVDVEDVYEPNVDVVCMHVLGSTDSNHPFVSHLQKENCVYVGGKTRVIHPIQHFDFTELRSTPAQVKESIAKNNWKTVVGFQTRNPLHRSHFELTKVALEEAAASTGHAAHLLLTPACGPTQPGDIEYHVRVRCYKKILPYYKELCGQDAGLVTLPLAMRMAGPREALWHALIRKNYGCTHFIVGRDHAGPSRRKADGTPFYGPYEAHEFLKSFEKEIGIVPVFGKNVLYMGEGKGYIQEGQPGADPATAVQISGTEFRRLLENREPVPSWYSFPEVVQELHLFYKKRCEQGFCVYFTGLPCSGKTTLACAVESALLEREGERRKVTIFDADVIRTHLSKGLGFDRASRQMNVRRIGYVSSLVVEHGGISLVANIAPYEEDRQFNRDLITASGGGYIEAYVSTPIDVCEGRDVKELYKKARAGVIQQFTGVSDPYETPARPELIIDSTSDIAGKVRMVVDYLLKEGWIL